MHDFFSSEYFGLRSLRKTIARFSGFHGFFSGKVPSTGVAITVVESEEGGGPEPESGGFTAFGRRFSWPWVGWESEDVVVSLPEDETADTDSHDQFWLGFRWGRREAETEADGRSMVLDAAADSRVQDVDVAGSGWSRVRGMWGFGRSDSSRPAMAEMEVDMLSETEEDGEVSSARPPRSDGVAGVQSTLNIDRPWLSIGWTPWGPPARKLEGDLIASEAPTDPAALEESDVVSDAEEHAAEALGEKGDGSATQEDESLLSRWWPGSSSRAAGATNEEQLEGEQGGKEIDGVGVISEKGEEAADRPEDDGTVGGDSEVDVAKEEQQTLLRRWWPVANEPTYPAALEQDGVGVSEEAGGEAREFMNFSPQEEARKEVDVEKKPAPVLAEHGLTSRLWLSIFKAAGTSGNGGGDEAPMVQQHQIPLSQEEEETAQSRDDSEGGDQLVGEVIVTEEFKSFDEQGPSSEEGESEPGDREETDGGGEEEEREAEDDEEDTEIGEEGEEVEEVGGQAQQAGEDKEGNVANEESPSQDGPGHAVSDSGEGIGGGSEPSSRSLSVDTASAGSDAAGDGEGVVTSTFGKSTTRSEDPVEDSDGFESNANEEKHPAGKVDQRSVASKGAVSEDTTAAGPTRQKEPTVGKHWGWQR